MQKNKPNIQYTKNWAGNHPHHNAFFILTEIYLQNTHLEAEVKMRNLTTIRADRVDRRKGGTVIFLHDSVFAVVYCELGCVHNKSNH